MFPELTTEQKAVAFDRLLQQCGRQRGELLDFRDREISTPGAPPSAALFLRVPCYTFTIIGEDLPTFADVLFHLATRKA